jgi:hypothetical protein
VRYTLAHSGLWFNSSSSFIETEFRRAAWHNDRTLLWTISVNIVELHRIDPPCRVPGTISSALAAMERSSRWMKQNTQSVVRSYFFTAGPRGCSTCATVVNSRTRRLFTSYRSTKRRYCGFLLSKELNPNRKSLTISLQTLRNHLHHMNKKLRTTTA